MGTRRTAFASLLALSLLAASRGSEFAVTTVAELKAALLAASQNAEDDTIVVAAGTYDVSGDGLRWTPGWPYAAGWPFGTDNHALVIQGAGAGVSLLDGGNATRVLYVNTQSLQTYHAAADSPAHVTLQGLTFRHGDSTGDSVSTSGGGALALLHWADLTVAECVFRDNTGVGGGGLAGGVTYDTGVATVRDSQFLDNTGGGLALGGNIVFERNTLTGNVNASMGGGANLGCHRGTMVVSGNVFSGNRGTYYGGGLHAVLGYYTGVTATIVGNVFAGNDAGPSGRGGAVWLELQTDAVCTVVNSTMTGNRANSDGGLAVWFKAAGDPGAPAGVRPTLNLYNSILWGNTAPDVRLSRDDDSTIVSYHNDIQSSYVDPWGSPVQAAGNLALPPLFVGAGHWDDAGTPGDGTDDVWVAGDYGLQTGSPCVDAGTNAAPSLPAYDLQGNDRIIDGNSDGMAVVDMGAYELPEAGLQVIAAAPTACGFGEVVVGFSRWQEVVLSSQGTAALAISAIRLAGSTPAQFGLSGSCTTIAPGGQCTVLVGFAPTVAGAWSATLEIDSGDPDTPTLAVPLNGTGRGSRVFRVDGTDGDDANDGSAWDQALRGLPMALGLAGDGDEIWVREGTYLLGFVSTGILIDRAVGIYGGFAGDETQRDDRDWRLHETTVDANAWAERCFHITASATLDGLTIARGNAPNYPTFPDNAGGGIYVSGSAAPVIANCRITENQADVGAGIYHAGAGLTLRDCVISGNAADELGGGIYTTAPLSMTGTTVSGNDANGDGGGILNEGPLLAADCVISGNTGVVGGGICTRNSPGVSLTMVRGSIAGNTAHWSGGGVAADGGGVKLLSVVVSNNTATSYEGGGVWGGGEYTNCVFAGNVAAGYGGALYSPGLSVAAVLTNCTIVGNGATRGGGVATGLGDRPVPPQVHNCILVANTAASTSYGPQVYPLAPQVRYSAVDQEGYAGSDGNIRADPCFIDLAHGDYHLRGVSPCIDAGDSGAIPADSADLDGDANTTEPLPWDLAGRDRCFDAPRTDTGNGPAPVVDMGAYEYIGDDDEDGVADDDEMGPGGDDPAYDGNADGRPDRLQANVASLPTADGLDYATIAAPEGTVLTGVAAAASPSPADAPPGVDYPFGFFRFTVHGLAPGSATIVTLHLPPGYALVTYHRYGPEPGNPTPHWYEFLYDGTTGAEIDGRTVTLHLVDGARGDDDLTADGTVVDDGAPGRLTAGLPADLTGHWSALTVTPVKPPKKYLVEGTLVVRNSGFATVSAKARITVYLSADEAVNKGDKKLGTFKLPVLEPGSEVTFTFAKKVSGDPSGKVVLAVLDATNKVVEEDESNNTVVAILP